MPKFSEMDNLEVIEWINIFLVAIAPDPAKYFMTAAQVTALEAKRDDLQEKVNATVNAKNALGACEAAEDTSRKALNPDISFLNTTIKANHNIADADKSAAGIDLPKARTKTPPVRPENLVVNGYEDGRNVIKFDRAGNKPNTLFEIQEKLEGQEEFHHLQTTTGTKHERRDAKPGQRATYRVRAIRDGMESTWSNEATVY